MERVQTGESIARCGICVLMTSRVKVCMRGYGWLYESAMCWRKTAREERRSKTSFIIDLVRGDKGLECVSGYSEEYKPDDKATSHVISYGVVSRSGGRDGRTFWPNRGTPQAEPYSIADQSAASGVVGFLSHAHSQNVFPEQAATRRVRHLSRGL